MTYLTNSPKTIGLVSPTAVPFTSVPLGQTTFQITTSVGRSLQTYDLKRGLSLVFLSSPVCPELITATCAYRDRVFVAWGTDKTPGGRGIWVFKRGRYIGSLELGDSAPQKLIKILVFGNWIIGCGAAAIDVWKSETYEHYTSIRPGSRGSSHQVFSGCICTLPTFLNKVFVGRADGSIDIYNVSTARLVHTIALDASAGPVVCLAPAPALSLLAVAHANGSLRIIDVETEEVAINLQQPNTAKTISSISFRTDGAGAGDDGRSEGIMATASIESGDITLWDLTRGGKVAGILRAAHETSTSTTASGITGMEFLPGQPVIVSSGMDNALRSWIFDQVPFSPIPRILHSRSGHASSITTLKFVPSATDGSEANGKWLMSAGNDRSLWGFSLRKDSQSTEFSQGNVKHKAKKVGKLTSDESGVEDFKCPPITSIACSLNRDGGMGTVTGPIWTNPSTQNAEEASMTGWESIVTAHEGDRYARTWSWGRKKAGRWAFETSDRKPVTGVAITACGTFALVGSAGGALDMFNLQSGVHRQRFPARLKAGQAKQLKLGRLGSEPAAKYQKGHSNAVTGIVVDNLNHNVISSGLDGQLIFWQFLTGQVESRIKLDGVPTAVRYNSVSGLMSVACDDLCVRVVDIETKKVVRELWGCVGQIYDHCFSHDGRWIVTCSMDSVVRIFDLATGHLIDAFKTNTCTNVAFSSTGEFLATAHAGHIGINIWNNKSLFMSIPSRQIDEDKDIIDLTGADELQAPSQVAMMDDEPLQLNVMGEIDVEKSVAQLDTSLLTLSLVPQSRWQTLLNLETIRQRNKPIQPPQKPKAAPFFLGSLAPSGMNASGMAVQEASPELAVMDAEKSRISRLTSLQPGESRVSTYLETFDSDKNVDDLITYMTALSPSAADLAIRSLDMQEMPLFVRALTLRLQQRRDFELVNTWMAVFLKLHGEFVAGVEEVKLAVIEYQQAMQGEEDRLGRSVGWAKGVVEFLRSAR